MPNIPPRNLEDALHTGSREGGNCTEALTELNEVLSRLKQKGCINQDTYNNLLVIIQIELGLEGTSHQRGSLTRIANTINAEDITIAKLSAKLNRLAGIKT